MHRLHELEVFSLLSSNNSNKPLPPSEAAQQLFRDIRPSLNQQPWNQQLDVGESTPSHRKTSVNAELFKGAIAWTLEDPGDITFVDNPTGRHRVNETLRASSLEGNQQATINFIRNVFEVATVATLSEIGADDPQLADCLHVNILLEATTPNGQSSLHAAFGASSEFFPNGKGGEFTKIAHQEGAYPYNYRPGAQDIVALRETVGLMRNALSYLRQTTPA